MYSSLQMTDTVFKVKSGYIQISIEQVKLKLWCVCYSKTNTHSHRIVTALAVVVIFENYRLYLEDSKRN